MKTAPNPVRIPATLDWPAVAPLVREATQALMALRLGVARSPAARLSSDLDGVALDLGVLRVVLAHHAPAGFDLGVDDDPPEVKPATTPARKPIDPERRRELAEAAVVVGDRLAALVNVPGLDSRLVARARNAAFELAVAWPKAATLLDPDPSAPRPDPPHRMFRPKARRR